MTSTNQLNYWKATSSQSPITASSTTSTVSSTTVSVKKRFQYLTNCILNALNCIKWPLAILFVIASIGALVYFLLIQSDMLDQKLSHIQQINLNSHHNKLNDDLYIKKTTTATATTIQMPIQYDDDTDYLQQQERTSINYLNKYNNINRNKLNANENRTNLIQQNYTQQSINNDAEHLNESFQSIKKIEHKSENNNINNSAPKHTTILLNVNGDDLNENIVERTRLLFPTKDTLKQFGFTSGHQNNFGIPIEEDERILRMLNEEILNSQEKFQQNDRNSMSTATDSNLYQTKVSPTLPILPKIDSITTERLQFNTTDDGEYFYLFIIFLFPLFYSI